MDNADGRPNISRNDYEYLKQLTDKRNYWAHKGFAEFVYVPNWLESKEYSVSCAKLGDDHKRLESVYKSVEEVRLLIIDKYER